jgi:ATP-dependent DNA helicase 2 subunit 2
MALTRSYVIIAQRANDKASMALSSFIHALYELDNYAVARLVTKDGKEPILTLLAPSIEPDFECLLEVQIPFAEDCRTYRFPPLDRVITVSGATLTHHRNLPNDELKKSISDYVDEMDLSKLDTDEEGYVYLI